MPDREKVIKGLEHCLGDNCNDDKWDKCEYRGRGCIGNLLEDALALLKAQEPVEPVYPTWYEWLTSIGAVTRKVKPDVASTLIETGLLDPIPAGLAQKLGVEPK